jgi:MFS superfamily sulfate permease-like transporter
MQWLPGLLTLREYRAGWLPSDIVAGMVLATMLVPVGIAYAVASGVPGICGLYATIVPLLAYALFGPSRILVLGPDSSLAAVILSVVLPLSGGDPLRAVGLAGMMALVSGIVCIVAGAARLGFVTELLSKPIRYGYMNGIALTVLISQLPKLFGFSIEGDGPLRKLWAIAEAVVGGKMNWTAFAVGAGALAVILLLKNSKRVPGILIAVIAATAIVGALDLATRAGVSVLGPLPRGLPAFAIPWITYAEIVPVLIGGCAVAVVSFADTSVLSPRLRRANRSERRSQSGDGRARRRQSGRRVFSGLSDQQQFVAHPCSGSRRRPDAVDRRRWCACCRPAASGGAESATESAGRGIGRGRHRLSHWPDRGH